MRGVLMLPVALALAACNVTAGSGPEPAAPDAKAVILANKQTIWKDADSIKNASITAPWRHLGFIWHVCVRMNAKNSFGGYTGENDSVVGIWDDGRPPKVLAENDTLNCASLPHAPFRELEGGYKAPGPQAKAR